MNAEIGSISHATMRPEDLIPCFRDALVELDTDKEHSKLIDQIEDGVL